MAELADLEGENQEILTLDDNPQLDDALIMRLTYDLATKLHKPEVIAHRYGLGGIDELKSYLKSHPAVVQRARKLHALFESDGASEERVRMKFLQATEELIIPMAGLVADPRTPLSARIDGFKQIQRGAGLDGLSASTKAQQGKEVQPFSLVINFAGGREAFNLNATTVVDDQIPPLTALTSPLGIEEDEDPQEEVDI